MSCDKTLNDYTNNNIYIYLAIISNITKCGYNSCKETITEARQ